MAVPKHKVSKSRGRSRIANWKASAPTLVFRYVISSLILLTLALIYSLAQSGVKLSILLARSLRLFTLLTNFSVLVFFLNKHIILSSNTKIVIVFYHICCRTMHRLVIEHHNPYRTYQ